MGGEWFSGALGSACHSLTGNQVEMLTREPSQQTWLQESLGPEHSGLGVPFTGRVKAWRLVEIKAHLVYLLVCSVIYYYDLEEWAWGSFNQ